MATDYNYPFSFHSDGGTGIDQPARDAAAVAQSTANQALTAAQALSKTYPDTATAQADAALIAGSYYTIPNLTSGALDLYRKDSSSASTFQFSLAQQAQVNANALDLNKIKETEFTTAFTTEPPVSTDPWVDIWTSITNPAVRWTTSIANGGLQMVQTFSGTLFRGALRKDAIVAPGMWIYGEVKIVASDIQTGVAVLIAPTATSGGVLTATNGMGIVIRQNGSVVALNGDALTAITGVIPGGSTCPPYKDGDVVGVGLLYDRTDPTKGNWVILFNGVLINVVAVSLLPTTGYLGIVVRNASVLTMTTVLTKVVWRATVVKDRYSYASSSAAAGGDGTAGKPFQTIQEGLISLVSRPGDHLELVIKGGDYRLTQGMSFSASRYREITVRCPAAERARIYGSTNLATGTTSWTKTATATNVWQNNLPRINMSAVPINMSRTQNLGDYDLARSASSTPRASYIAPFSSLKGLSGVGGAGGGLPTLVTQIALCDSTPGSFFTDGGTGILYVHDFSDADPNASTWERAEAPGVLNVKLNAPTEMNACRVNLAGLTLLHAYSTVATIQRAWVDIENCDFIGSGLGNGLNVDSCEGTVGSCSALLSWNDGFHSDPADLATIIRLPTVRFLDCVAEGQFIGDGWSAHELTKYACLGGRSSFNGKGGFAQCETAKVYNMQLNNNTGYALALVGQSVRELRELDAFNCQMTDSPTAALLQSFAGDTTRMRLWGGRIANTAGHSGGTNYRIVFDFSGNAGVTSFDGYDVRDGGNNSADHLGGPNPGTIVWHNSVGYCA
jgi:hypothetical protein